MTRPTVVGRTEIADLLDVDSRTPHAWFARGLLPEPDHASVNGSPAWDTDTIIKWAILSGRCPDDLRLEWDPYELFKVPTQRGGRAAKKNLGRK